MERRKIVTIQPTHFWSLVCGELLSARKNERFNFHGRLFHSYFMCAESIISRISTLNFFRSSFAWDDLLLSSELRWCEKDAHFFHDLHFPNHHLFLAIMTTPPHAAAARWSWKQKSWNEKFKQQKRRVKEAEKVNVDDCRDGFCHPNPANCAWLGLKKLQWLSQTLSSSSWTPKPEKRLETI